MCDRNKIRVLFLAANPTDVNFQPRIDKEFKEIRRKIRASGYGERFELISEWAVTPGDLTDALLEYQPHILHFSGHGSQADGIVLENEQGECFFLDQKSLANLLRVLKDNIRIVVLNACWSVDQAEYLKDIVDFTIGMEQAIGDDAARTFAAQFYETLARGRSVQDAFTLATNQIGLLKIPNSGDPTILTKHGIDWTKPPFPLNDNRNESVGLGIDSRYGRTFHERPKRRGHVGMGKDAEIQGDIVLNSGTTEGRPNGPIIDSEASVITDDRPTIGGGIKIN